MLELVRILAEQERARRDAFFAFVKPPTFAGLTESLAIINRVSLGKCLEAVNQIEAQNKANFQRIAAIAESIDSDRRKTFASLAVPSSWFNEKESEPAELTPTPKKRIGFRFED